MEINYRVVTSRFSGKCDYKEFTSQNDDIAIKTAQEFISKDSELYSGWSLFERLYDQKQRTVVEFDNKPKYPIDELGRIIKDHNEGLYGACNLMVDIPSNLMETKVINDIADDLAFLGIYARTITKDSDGFADILKYHNIGLSEKQMYVLISDRKHFDSISGMMQSQPAFIMSEDGIKIVKSRHPDVSKLSLADFYEKISVLIKPYIVHRNTIGLMIDDIYNDKFKNTVSQMELANHIESSTSCNAKMIRTYENVPGIQSGPCVCVMGLMGPNFDLDQSGSRYDDLLSKLKIFDVLIDCNKSGTVSITRNVEEQSPRFGDSHSCHIGIEILGNFLTWPPPSSF